MLTAFALAVVLQGAPGCQTCGGGHGGFPVQEGATGWFPFCSPAGWERIRNVCHGELIGFGADKCPCRIGSFVPHGDDWAMQMHGAYPVYTRPPAAGPAPANTSSPAQPTTPAAGASGPATGGSATAAPPATGPDGRTDTPALPVPPLP